MTKLYTWLTEKFKENYENIESKLNHTPDYRKYILKNYGERALSSIPKGFDVIKRLGEGSSGEAFLVKHPQSMNYLVIKYQVTESNNFVRLLHEAVLQRHFQEKNLGPALLATYFWKLTEDKVVAIFLMQYVPLILSNLLLREIPKPILMSIKDILLKLLQKLCHNGLRHNDLHWQNLGFIYTDNKFKLIPIDFGYSDIVPKSDCKLSIDLYWLVSFLIRIRYNRSNVEFLLEHIEPYLIQQFKKDFNIHKILWPTITEFQKQSKIIRRERPNAEKREQFLTDLKYDIPFLQSQLKY